MELAFNELLAGLDGFDYGRLDVMVEQPDLLTLVSKSRCWK